MRQVKNNLAGLTTELFGTVLYIALLFIITMVIAR